MKNLRLRIVHSSPSSQAEEGAEGESQRLGSNRLHVSIEIMGCDRCQQPAVLHQPWSGLHLCRSHLVQSVRRRVGKELRRQLTLPREGGTLLVAMSGGKDSAVLLHELYHLLGPRRNLQIAAVLVDEGIEGYRPPSQLCAQELCDRLGVELHIARMVDDLGRPMDKAVSEADAVGTRLGPCSFCGVFRRRGIERVAQEVGAFAVALGHNLDDTAQTVLMNFQKGDIDRMLRMAPHTNRIVDGLIPRILPLRMVTELEALLVAREHDLPMYHDDCPYAERGLRKQMRDVVAALEAATPGTRHGLLASADTIREQFPVSGGGVSAQSCTECGAPTSGSSCMPCTMRRILDDGDSSNGVNQIVDGLDPLTVEAADKDG